MAKLPTKDEKIEQLQKLIQVKKSEIAKAEKPKWETNCSYSLNGERINIQTVQDVDTLVIILSDISGRGMLYDESASVLGVNSIFKISGFTANEWITDLKTRVNKIQISKKKTELAQAEAVLETLLSPDAKADKQLKEIEKMLNS